MRLDLYDSIYSQLGGPSSVGTVQANHADERPDSILGIYLCKRRREARKAMALVRNLDLEPLRLYQEFRARWQSARSDRVVQEMAADYFGLSPCLMARLVLKSYHQSITSKEETGSLSAAASRYLANPMGLLDQDLAANVRHCIETDDVYSPKMDVCRHQVGAEYEARLCDGLRAAGIPFCTEDEMRKAGYPKTPDACLLEPIAVDGIVVKWIESKAWFGDPFAHAQYLGDQYWPYYNRFGPGMVIYWFGFVDELDTNRSNGIMLADQLVTSSIVKIESAFI